MREMSGVGMLQGKILVAQGGGPTAVINQSLAGVVLEARKFRTSAASTARCTACAASSTRICRPDAGDQPQPGNGRATRRPRRWARPATSPTLKYCQEIFKVLQAHEIGALLLYRRQRFLRHRAHRQPKRRAKANYPLRCIHIPKTIDNDLVGNDHTPGFPSAARFVAQAFAGANLDNAALPGVYIGVVMGRHAGFLTAAARARQEVPRRRPAPDLRAGAHVRRRQVPGRREGDL